MTWRKTLRRASGLPREVYYRFGARELGYIGNNGTRETAYAESIETRRNASPSNTAFGGGASVFHADFDQGVTPITSYTSGSSRGGYTVRAGETLASIAANLWGDASLWYKLAEANGLSGDQALSDGQRLAIPAGVMRSAYNAATFTPYDPSAVMGDTVPTAPVQPKPSKNNCGAFGQILMVVIAVAVSVVTAGAAAGIMAGLGNGILGSAAAGIGAMFSSGGLIAAVGVPTAMAAGAIGGAVGSIASQGVGVMTGIQEKFSWNAVAMAGIAGAIGGSGKLGVGGSNWGSMAARGAVASAITQGIGDLIGIHSKFSWASVAAAGVGAGFARQVGDHWLTGSVEGVARSLATGTASAIGNAASRSLIQGTDFGDNLMAALPDVIGSTIGSAISGEIAKAEYRKEVDRRSKLPVDQRWALLRKDLSDLGLNDDEAAAVMRGTRKANDAIIQRDLPPTVDSLAATQAAVRPDESLIDFGVIRAGRAADWVATQFEQKPWLEGAVMALGLFYAPVTTVATDLVMNTQLVKENAANAAGNVAQYYNSRGFSPEDSGYAGLGAVTVATTGAAIVVPGVAISAVKAAAKAIGGIVGRLRSAGSAAKGGVYSVDPITRSADIAAGVIENGRYIVNPTAQNLSSIMTSSGRIGGKNFNGQYMYVVDQSGNVVIGSRAGQRMPHPTLIGGENPQVLAAGIVDIRGGRIFSVNNASGHFKPGLESLFAARDAFSRLPSTAFRRDFRGYVPHNRTGN